MNQLSSRALRRGTKNRLGRRTWLGVEALEARTLLAFDLAIGAGPTTASFADAGGTRTFAPTASGQQVAVADLRAALQAGSNVAVTSGSSGSESGNLVWSTGANLDYDGIPAAQTLTLAASNAGSITLGSRILDDVAGGPSLNVVLTAPRGVLLTGAASGIDTSGGTYTVNADSDANGVGTYSQDNAASAVLTNGGTISITAADVAQAGTLHAGAGLATFVNSRTSGALSLGQGPTLTTTLDLNTSAQDVLVYGATTNDNLTSGTANALPSIATGDVNGDGVADVILGAPLSDGPSEGRLDSGEVYVYFGSGSLTGTKDVAGLSGTAPDVVIYGATAGDRLAANGALAAGDVNGDGIADIVVGAMFADGPSEGRPNAGEAYVIFGSTGLSGTKDLNAGAANVLIYGATASDALTDSALTLGDVTGDGVADIVLGAILGDGPANGRSDAGEAYVIFGGSGLTGTKDLNAGGANYLVYGATAFDGLTRDGALLVGDVNGDGVGDLILGARDADGPSEGRSAAGEAYVIFGSSGLTGTKDLNTSAANVLIQGATASDNLTGSGGLAVADLNGDGKADLLLGASGGDGPAEARGGAGEAYVIFGSATLSGTKDLGAGAANVLVYGSTASDALTAKGAITAGDVNGDGKADLILGAWGADGPAEARSNAGEAYVIFGSATLSGTKDLNAAAQDVLIYGATAGDNLTNDGAIATGDLNGDGVADLLLGASLGDGPANGRSDSGEAYVIFGAASLAGTKDLNANTQNVLIYGATTGDNLTASGAITTGDLNGDGLTDLILGAALADGPSNGRSAAGEAYVVYGVGGWTMTDAELDNVTAGTIGIGDAVSGSLNVYESITRSAATNLSLTVGGNKSITFKGTGNLQAGGGNVTLTTNGNGTGGVVSGTAAVDVTANQLTITTGSGGIGANGNPLAMSVSSLSTNSDRAVDGPQFLSEADSLTIAASDVTAGTATVTLVSGTYYTTASGSVFSPVVVNSGATLGGSGATSSVAVSSGASISPGASTGILATGSVNLQDNSSLVMEIGGATAGAYDQLAVTGTVTIGSNVALVVSAVNGFVPTAGNSFTLIDNDGSDPVTGTFAGLPEGSTIANFFGTTLDAVVSYVGGDGNDLVLAVQSIPTTTTVSLDASGNLKIEDTNGANTNDSLTIQADAASGAFVISDPNNLIATNIAGATGGGTNSVSVPFAKVTGSQILVNTLGGGDSLTFDVSLGGFSKTIAFEGGSGSDSAALTGGSFTAVTHAFTAAGIGSVIAGGNQIGYSGLEAVTDSLAATNRVFNFNGGAEAISLADAAGAAMTLASGLATPTTFANPSGSLTINAGSGDDSISIASVDANGPFRAALTIDGGVGIDAVLLAATMSLAAGNSVSVTADSIMLSQSITVAGSGSVTLAATNGVTLSGANADVTTAGGAFVVSADSDANRSGIYSQDHAGSAVATNGGPVTISAADVNLLGTIQSGNGLVSLVQSRPGSVLSLGQGATLPATLDLGTTGPDVLVNGGTTNDDLTSGTIAVGDVNGDGVSDLILGAPRGDGPSEARSDAGEVYVYFGSGSLAGTKDVAGLVGAAPDVVIYGATAGDRLAGNGALVVGDVNGDEIADIVVGAMFADGPSDGRPNGGEAYVIFGAASLGGTKDLNAGAADVVIYGATASDALTDGALTLGDLNGDGVADIVLGAVLGDGPANGRTDSGEAYVIFGGSSLSGTKDLNNGGANVLVYGATAFDGLTRDGALAVGDLNGDGVGDLILGARDADGPSEGRSAAGEAYVIFGSASLSGTKDLNAGAQNVLIYGATAGDNLTGSGGLAIGDVNGDGKTDLILGASAADGPGDARNGAGEAYAVFGSTTLAGTKDLNAGEQDLLVYGATASDALTAKGAITTGDLNGDGKSDLILGAWGADGPSDGRSNAGEAYVIFGSANLSGSRDLNAGQQDVLVYGATGGDNLTNDGAIAVGDVNGDGVADLLLGATFGDGPANGRSDTGEAYAIFGSAGLNGTKDLNANAQDLLIYGASAGDNLTSSGAIVAGDVNGDGLTDLILGATLADGPNNGRSAAGEAYVVFGTGGWTVTDAELNNVTAAAIGIGNATSGAITVNTAITRAAATNVSLANAQGKSIVFRGPGSVQAAGGVTSLSTGRVDWKDNSSLAVKFQGRSHDQLAVTGTVALGNNVALTVVSQGAAAPAVGDVYVLVANDGNDPVSGTFAGLPEGSFVGNFLGSGLAAAISYVGGDGNDIVLRLPTPPSIVATAADKAEGDTATTPFTFTISRDDGSGTMTVNYAVAGTGARPADANDFPGGVFPSGQVSFAAGETSRTITIDVRGEVGVEADEGFSVTLSDPGSGAALASARGTIRNDDSAVISLSGSTGYEAAGPVTFTVSINHPVDVPVMVHFDTLTGGTAKPDVDFTPVAGHVVTFPANSAASQTVTVMVLNENLVELDETVFAEINSLNSAGRNVTLVGGGTAIGSSGTIVNDDTASIKLTGDMASEKSGKLTFTANLRAPVDVPVTVNFDTLTTGTATVGVDFTAISGQTITFPAFSTGEQTVTVAVADDRVAEPNESVDVELNSLDASGRFVVLCGCRGSLHGSGTITDNDVNLEIAALSARNYEGHSETTAFTFTVTRSGLLNGTTTVDYLVAANGVNAADFGGSLPSGTVTFVPNETSATITIQVSGDRDVEADEPFTVALSNAADSVAANVVDLVTPTATGTILSDDIDVAISPLSAVKYEGHRGTTEFTFTVSRTGAINGMTTVEYVVDSDAANAADFGGTLPSGTVTFDPNETSQTLTINVSGDRDIEGDEPFTITLRDAADSETAYAVDITTSTASGTIRNDDIDVAISPLSAVSYEGHSGTTAFTFTVARGGATDGSTTVNYAVAGNGVNAADFGGTLPTGSITFAPGETSTTLTINVSGDRDIEGHEPFTVTLTSGADSISDYAVDLVTTRADGTILNDDIDVGISPLSAVKYEDGGNAAASSSLAAPSSSPSTQTTYQLNLSHIECVNNVVEVHFVLLNVPAGVTPGPLTYTYTFNGGAPRQRTIQAGKNSGNVWHYTDNPADGAYYVMAATVNVGGVAVRLHNPGDYSGTYDCASGTTITPFTFSVTRTGATDGTTTVSYAVSGGTANAADFGGTLPSGTVSFAPGETAKTLTVYVRGDRDVEPDETFVVTLSNATDSVPAYAVDLAPPSATGTILNDDIDVAIRALSAAKNEGSDCGNTPFTFTVTRVGALSGTTTVDYSVAAGTVDAADFGGRLPSGSVSFAPGQTSLTLTINVVGDKTVEPNETFAVTLRNARDSVLAFSVDIATPSASGTIVNDDVAAPMTLTVPPLVAGQNTITVNNAIPGTTIAFVRGTGTGSTTFATYGVTTGVAAGQIYATAVADSTGTARAKLSLQKGSAGQPLALQAFETTGTKRLTNVVLTKNPLLAASGEGPGAAAISDEQLAPIVAEAKRRWETTGLPIDVAARLYIVNVMLADLDAGRLGEAAGQQVRIDRDAAGHGWFVDPSPADDSEFTRAQPSGDRWATASATGESFDLLTVVMHELGHTLGIYDHDDGETDVMTDRLAPGTRRTVAPMDVREELFRYLGETAPRTTSFRSPNALPVARRDNPATLAVRPFAAFSSPLLGGNTAFVGSRGRGHVARDVDVTATDLALATLADESEFAPRSS